MPPERFFLTPVAQLEATGRNYSAKNPQKTFKQVYFIERPSLTCLRNRTAMSPKEDLSVVLLEVISNILSTINEHCASSLQHSLIVICDVSCKKDTPIEDVLSF